MMCTMFCKYNAHTQCKNKQKPTRETRPHEREPQKPTVNRNMDSRCWNLSDIDLKISVLTIFRERTLEFQQRTEHYNFILMTSKGIK